jgi:hypothetical protein
MLVASAIRPREFTTFLSDLPLWTTVDPKHKPVLIAHEWLALYEGDEPGPLSRHQEARWEALFDEVGYFHVRHLVKETAPSVFSDELNVIVGATIPDPFPRLYRLAREEWRDRWSWVSASESAASLIREDGELWTTDSPRTVFGRITELMSPFPGSTAMKRTIFDEFIVRPGEVRLFTPSSASQEERAS